jgi:hypothetical protein
MTQREKLAILMPRLQIHNYFDGPYMISRAEGEVILKAMEHQLKDLEHKHKRYMERQDELNQRAKDRYKQKKMEVLE